MRSTGAVAKKPDDAYAYAAAAAAACDAGALLLVSCTVCNFIQYCVDCKRCFGSAPILIARGDCGGDGCVTACGGIPDDGMLLFSIIFAL